MRDGNRIHYILSICFYTDPNSGVITTLIMPASPSYTVSVKVHEFVKRILGHFWRFFLQIYGIRRVSNAYVPVQPKTTYATYRTTPHHTFARVVNYRYRTLEYLATSSQTPIYTLM